DRRRRGRPPRPAPPAARGCGSRRPPPRPPPAGCAPSARPSRRVRGSRSSFRRRLSLRGPTLVPGPSNTGTSQSEHISVTRRSLTIGKVEAVAATSDKWGVSPCSTTNSPEVYMSFSVPVAGRRPLRTLIGVLLLVALAALAVVPALARAAEERLPLVD